MRRYAVFVGVLALCAVFAVAFWTRVWRVIEPDMEPVLEAAQAAEGSREGVEFGRSHSADECEDEALRRLNTCDGAACRARLVWFTRICLRNAGPSDRVCEDVPLDEAQALLWSLNRCAQLSPDHKRCERILDERAAFCAEAVEKRINPSRGSAEK
jgi:hypothetical protein